MEGRDSYVGPELEAVVFQTSSSYPPTATLLWFPGSGQRCDNELLRRLVNALHTAGASLRVIGVKGQQALSSALRLCPEGLPLLVGGHSMGGGTAAVLASGRGSLLNVPVTVFSGLVTVNAVESWEQC
uniref:1-alkyl-2-acetylglycerophosphocholine esterase n=1 Tax=Chromera velia CCMP2878 TaxID=1169474 RepID=A0A0G4HTE8_9ALVE|eukprot:Cvel_8465.t1-p1 / transcript=Cvel_8465.t1 / gene=Cvel_8465 / organism=Chromera_velia_CCMP2878 / gene_product=hypothetical protein / transcript_product=hypothetical protein / location=Cvel_scaffold467:78134-78514(+) / protein_length=127 / sequence_SO=supercontig / SO=protein_coding / is_pseudo=false